MSEIDLVVVHCPVGGGHKAAALATAEAARARGLSVAIVDAFEHAPRWATDAYLTAHLTGQNAAPELYGEMYFRSNRRGALDPVRIRFDHLLFGGLARRVRELAPRAVVATHHLPLVVLGRERRKGRLTAPLVGVVTDYIAHACWAERGVDAFAVPTVRAGRELVGHGVDPRAVFVTGIPVREAFERLPPVLPRRDGRLSVLVTSGGFGVGPITKIVESFAGIPDVDLVVVCGATPKLPERVREVARRLSIRATAIGFEKDMASRIARADLVVGKAGGLTVTETMTAGRPMVVASAIPGNEAVNERFVVGSGAGVSADPAEVGATIALVRSRALVRPMAARARKLVRRGAARAIVELELALALASTARAAA